MVNVPFYTKKACEEPGYPVGYIMGKRNTKGEIGIEIECEGNKFKKEYIPAPWVYHKDGSLRGVDNAEYVLAKPIMFTKVPEAINILWKMLDEYGSVLDVSNRTSVHIHLNMQKFHLNRLTSFLALYFSVEELLTEWCGAHRVGNLFCLRARDATAIITHLKKFIQNGGHYELRDGLHYAGLNANALHKFGSIEIRTLRGVVDPAVILDWVSMLERLYVLSAEYKDPREVVSSFSSEGPLNYLNTILGDHTKTLLDGIDYSNDKVRDSLYDGIRLAQDLCFCRDWSEYNPTEIVEDPFGRVKKKSLSTGGELAQGIHMINMINHTSPPLETYAHMYENSTYDAPTPQAPAQAIQPVHTWNVPPDWVVPSFPTAQQVDAIQAEMDQMQAAAVHHVLQEPDIDDVEF